MSKVAASIFAPLTTGGESKRGVLLALDQLQQKAVELAASGVNQTHALRTLIPDIEKVKKQGVKHSQLLKVLSQAGFNLNSDSFKNFLYREKKSSPRSSVALDSLKSLDSEIVEFKCKAHALHESGMSITGIICGLVKEIEFLSSIGISRSKLVKLLNDSGISMSPGTLKTILSRVRAGSSDVLTACVDGNASQFQTECTISVQIEISVKESLLKVADRLNAGAVGDQKLGVPEVLAILADAAASIISHPNSEEAEHLRSVLGL